MLTVSGAVAESVAVGLRRELTNGFIVGTVPGAIPVVLAGPAVGVIGCEFPTTAAPPGVVFNVPPAADLTAGSVPPSCVAVCGVAENNGIFEAPTIEVRGCTVGLVVVPPAWSSVRC